MGLVYAYVPFLLHCSLFRISFNFSHLSFCIYITIPTAWYAAARKVNYEYGESESLLEGWWDLGIYEQGSSNPESWEEYEANYVEKSEWSEKAKEEESKGKEGENTGIIFNKGSPDLGVDIQKILQGTGKKRERVKYGKTKVEASTTTTEAPSTTAFITMPAPTPRKKVYSIDDREKVINYIENVVNNESLAWRLLKGKGFVMTLDIGDPEEVEIYIDYLKHRRKVLKYT